MNKDEILEEATRLYTPGTKFYPPHLVKDENTICTVSETDTLYWHDRTHLLFSTGNVEKNGHPYNELVWYDGKWAEIEERKLQIEEVFDQVLNKLTDRLS